jgi:hypothetical protein
MKKLMNVLMLSCKKASGLIEKKLHFPLNPVEKTQLFLHTSMCDACKSYQKQSKELDGLLDKHFHTNPDQPDTTSHTLSSEIKAKIISDLEKNK